MSIRLNGKIIAGNSKSTYTGFEIGDIGISSLGIDENQNRRRYLNGQIIISEQFVAFTEKLKSASTLHPTLICTEEEWQTISSLSVGGQCGKFVIDDEAGTIRLPRIIMPIQGLTNLANLAEIVEAGLPNIKGEAMPRTDIGLIASVDTGVATGAFKKGTKSGAYLSSGGSGFHSLEFDASLSNPIYGNSNTVQQEQIQYPYFIQVTTGCDESIDTTREIELNNPYVLFESKFFENEIYNASWLLANGTYNGSNAVHPSAYQALLVENNAEVAIGSIVTLPIGTEYTKRGLIVKLSTDSDITDYDFVLNTTDETFRLPIKVNLASGKAVIGNGMTLGMTNGSSNFALTSSSASPYQVQGFTNIYNTNVGTVATGNSLATKVGYGVTTDPTKSGIETNDSGLYLYFYVGETVQNANLINAGRIEEKLATVIPDNSSLISGYAMPSDKYVSLTVGASGTQYTAPANGWFCVTGLAKTTLSYIYLRNRNAKMYNNIIVDQTSGVYPACFLPAKKGQIVTFEYGGMSSLSITFTYATGSESEVN